MKGIRSCYNIVLFEPEGGGGGLDQTLVGSSFKNIPIPFFMPIFPIWIPNKPCASAQTDLIWFFFLPKLEQTDAIIHQIHMMNTIHHACCPYAKQKILLTSKKIYNLCSFTGEVCQENQDEEITNHCNGNFYVLIHILIHINVKIFTRHSFCSYAICTQP